MTEKHFKVVIYSNKFVYLEFVLLLFLNFHSSVDFRIDFTLREDEQNQTVILDVSVYRLSCFYKYISLT